MLLPPLLAGTSPARPLTQLSAYRTQADPRVGLLVNVAGFYGFFRQGPTEPKDLISRWPAVLAALMQTVTLGYVAVLRDAAQARRAGHPRPRAIDDRGLVPHCVGLGGASLSRWADEGSPGPTGYLRTRHSALGFELRLVAFPAETAARGGAAWIEDCSAGAQRRSRAARSAVSTHSRREAGLHLGNLGSGRVTDDQLNSKVFRASRRILHRTPPKSFSMS